MIKWIFLLFCLHYSINAYALYDWKVLRVVDGDTVEVEAKWLPSELGDKIKVRIYGVDTPEKPPRAQCKAESTKAKIATEHTKKFISKGKQISIEIKSWDKYGGRVLGDIIVDNKSLRQSLIESQFAKQYFGEAKQSWCN